MTNLNCMITSILCVQLLCPVQYGSVHACQTWWLWRPGMHLHKLSFIPETLFYNFFFFFLVTFMDFIYRCWLQSMVTWVRGASWTLATIYLSALTTSGKKWVTCNHMKERHLWKPGGIPVTMPLVPMSKSTTLLESAQWVAPKCCKIIQWYLGLQVEIGVPLRC